MAVGMVAEQASLETACLLVGVLGLAGFLYFAFCIPETLHAPTTPAPTQAQDHRYHQLPQGEHSAPQTGETAV